MEDIMEAAAQLQAGQVEAARKRLLELWSTWSDVNAPLERCTIAHFLADTEPDAQAELAWDLLALEAATGSSAPANRPAVDAKLNGFLPSLHLNLGDVYRRLGDPARARGHVEAGLAAASSLGNDGYGMTTLGGLQRLARRLAESA